MLMRQTQPHNIESLHLPQVEGRGRQPPVSKKGTLGAALLDFLFMGYNGGFASEKAAYDSSFLLTSFSEPRGLRWDEVGANGAVSGTR